VSRAAWRLCALVLVACLGFCGCGKSRDKKLVIGSKFFTEQVVLAELLAQHIAAKTGAPIERKTNLGGTLLVQKALLAGQVDVYVEYTGTALTAVLGERPEGDSAAVYRRVKEEYAKRFQLAVTEPLGFENTFAMVIRGEDARNLHLVKTSDIASVTPKWSIGVGYEFLERPDGFTGWSQRYGLRFSSTPKEMDLGLLYRALMEKQVDIVAGNSTDGVIAARRLVILEDDRRYFPPYDAVPIVREDTLNRFPGLRETLAELGGKITAAEMRQMNYAVDGEQRDVRDVVREFREKKAL